MYKNAVKTLTKKKKIYKNKLKTRLPIKRNKKLESLSKLSFI
jgi:hypothetical protein